MSQQIATKPGTISEAANVKEVLFTVLSLAISPSAGGGILPEQVIRVIFIFKFCSTHSTPDLPLWLWNAALLMKALFVERSLLSTFSQQMWVWKRQQPSLGAWVSGSSEALKGLIQTDPWVPYGWGLGQILFPSMSTMQWVLDKYLLSEICYYQFWKCSEGEEWENELPGEDCQAVHQSLLKRVDLRFYLNVRHRC